MYQDEEEILALSKQTIIDLELPYNEEAAKKAGLSESVIFEIIKGILPNLPNEEEKEYFLQKLMLMILQEDYEQILKGVSS